MISFMTFTTMTGSVRVRVVRFTRETTVKNGNVYDVDVLPDGTEQYSINSRSVEILPDLPSTQELMKSSGIRSRRLSCCRRNGIRRNGAGRGGR